MISIPVEAPRVDRTARRWIDAVLVAALTAVAYLIGVSYERRAVAAGYKPEFYQREFGPAVMTACGRGYVSPVRGQAPALDRFLDVERDSLQCSEIPTNVQLEPRLSLSQFVWKYLLWSAALIWRMRGISWSALIPLSGLLFAATVALSYALARLVAGRVASSFVAAAVILSPLHWSQLPHIRDYSKAPFMLGLILLLALIVRGPIERRRVLVLSGLFGVLLGIGFGFRNDLLIAVPAFAAAAVFLPGGVLAHAKLKVAACGVAAVAFAGSVWPMLEPYREGGGLQVVALLGFTSPFDRALDIDPPPYEFGYRYSDWYMGAIVRDYARRIQRRDGAIPLYRGVYNTAATAIIIDLVRTVPADMLARAYASVVSVARLPASNWTAMHWPPGLRSDDRWQRMFEARSRWLARAEWLWPAAVVGALLVGSIRSLRLAAFTVFLLAYFTGYPGIQFHERHYFYLDIVPLLALASLAAQIPCVLAWRRSGLPSGADVRRAGTRAIAFGLAVVAAAVVPLAALRAYQQRTLRATFADRLAATRVPVTVTDEPAADARVIVQTETLPADREADASIGAVTTEYLVARVGGDRCEALRVPITLRYQTPYQRGDFSRTILVALGPRRGATADVLAPVYYRRRPDSDATDITDRYSEYRFRGFELGSRDRACLERVERVADKSRFPLLLSATLEPGWRDTALYQTLAAVERRHNGPLGASVFSVPADLRLPRAIVTESLAPMAIIAKADALTSLPGGGWTMNGVGGIGREVGPFGYLLVSEARPTLSGALLVVDGTLRRGGLSVGVVRNDQWLVQTPVIGAGAFLAVVQVPGDGSSTVVIANNLPTGPLTNDFDIRRAGWFDPDEAR